MSEMVERVARAIDDASNETSLAFMAPLASENETIRLCRAADRAKRMAQARAAVEAMMVPTAAMLAATTTPEMVYLADTLPDEAPLRTWEAMISAALTKQP